MIVPIQGPPTVWYGVDGRLMASLPVADDVMTLPFPGDAAFEAWLEDLERAYQAAKLRRAS